MPSKARGSAAVALDPQVIQPQDEAKAGAQFPDGVQVVVIPDRPNKLERHGGLAKTGW